jgi:uncharacterized protein YcgI (DUF1989 family)
MAKTASRRDPALKLLMRVGSTEVDFEGREAFLAAELTRLLDVITHSHNTQVKATLTQEVEASQVAHSNLDDSHAQGSRLEEQLIQRVDAFGQEVADFLALVAAGGSSQDQLLNATKQMQETQMSFNMQYLQLQSQMQHENRSYTAISNIMKTKHDTVKNSISNIR